MDAYQFSAIHEGSAIAFSPGSTFIAVASRNTVFVHSATTLQPVRRWDCTTPRHASDASIDDIKWSSNGSRLLVSSRPSGCAWVLDLSCAAPTAYIETPLQETDWGPDDIRVWTDTSLTLYNLEQGTAKLVQQVQTGKHAFSPDRRYMATPERHSGKEFLGIYDSESLVRHFPISVTDAYCLSWSPCGKWIAVADWKLSYAVHVYSPVGKKVGSFQRPASVLGVKELAWSPNGRYLALGGYDGIVRVLESESWQPISVVGGFENGALAEAHRPERNAAVQFRSAPGLRESGPAEVTHLDFSNDGRLMFFTQEKALHVYSFLPEPSSATPDVSHWTSVVLNDSISEARICPSGNRIVIVSDSSTIYFWKPDGMEGVQIPEDRVFHPNRIFWAPDGQSMALCDSGLFCIVYAEPTEETGEHWEED